MGLSPRFDSLLFPGYLGDRLCEMRAPPAAIEAAATRVRDAGATIVCSGSAADEIDASYVPPVPAAPTRRPSRRCSVVPGSLFAAALAQTARAGDADRPWKASNKVTIAR